MNRGVRHIQFDLCAVSVLMRSRSRCLTRETEAHTTVHGVVEGVLVQNTASLRVYVGNLSYDVKWHQLKDFNFVADDLSAHATSKTDIFHVYNSQRTTQ
jgi:hypothetical protein